VSTVLVLYAIVLLLDAVEGSTDGSADTTDASATGRVEDEGDFGRVKRHLSAIIATFLTFFLILMVAHQTRIYADVTDRAGVDVIGGFVVAVQFVLSAAVGIAYLVHRRWVRRPLATNWRGASRFGLLSVGFVLISTLLCQWAGTIPSCDQIHWLVLAGAVAAHGAIIGYATIVIGRPWLRLQGS
jgi:hypothetical protein